MLCCPVPPPTQEKILLAHGSGGKLTSQLIENIFLPAFGRHSPNLHDGAVFRIGEEEIAFTTDSYVVSPLFFPGGNIGDLAVNGTVNDLAMCGARPLFLSCACILEEGFEIKNLISVTDSMKKAAAHAGVALVTGDTKVVERGKGDGLYITTSGVGKVQKKGIAPNSIRSGDALLINGDLGRHGTAILSVREGLAFQSEIQSDTNELWSLVEALIQEKIRVRCLRDLTRGGLATVLAEIAKSAQLGIEIEEEAVPLHPAVKSACEFLGLDPLYVASEGRLIAFVDPSDVTKAIDIMKRFDPSAAVIGKTLADARPFALAKTSLGTKRILDLLTGEQLPRIC